MGVVFEIAKTAGGYASTPTVLLNFDGATGANPVASLLLDGSGNLYGTAFQGGAYNAGTVFELAKTTDGYASAATVLFSFDFTNGSLPGAALTADSHGNVFSTTLGGGPYGDGVVFELAKTDTGYASTPNVLVNFDYTNGATPNASVLIDGNANLFSTASAGGVLQHGTVFEIVKTASGYANTPTILVNFTGTDGAVPLGGLLAGVDGKLLGTTQQGGRNGAGTVFELTNTGFVPPVQFAGKPGAADCATVSDAALKQSYGDLSAAAKSLGYKDQSELKKAVDTWCAAQ